MPPGFFFGKISMTWKVLENEFHPGLSWKLKFEVLESPGIYLWFNLTNMPFIYIFISHDGSTDTLKTYMQTV